MSLDLRRKMAVVVRLAAPLALAELGWVAMSVVDTMMVGRLGAEAIGAVSIGSGLFIFAAIFGIGLMFGLDYFVAHAFGAGRFVECARWLIQGVWLALFLTPVLMLLAWYPARILERFGVDEKVASLMGPYIEILALSILPLLLYSCFRRYLQARSSAIIITFALVSANLVNGAANWLFIFGNLGMPELGVTGAGWATLISRIYLALVLLGRILWSDWQMLKDWVLPFPGPDLQYLRRLVRVGFPAALQVTLEVGVFATATALAGVLEPVSLAAHQVALSTASVTFMVPLGISSAGAVLVGQALGRGSLGDASSAGWISMGLGAAFMFMASLFLILTPGPILRLFTSEVAVIATGIPLLGIAAVFQVFDGIQVIATGILRGAGETTIPMVANLVAHWFFGLPIGYFLCFVCGEGVTGLWVGLSAGLIIVSICLVLVWVRRIGEMRTVLRAGS